jgi:hypothetical protein
VKPALRVWYPFPLAIGVFAWLLFWGDLAWVVARESWRPRHGTWDLVTVAFAVVAVLVVVGSGPATVLHYSSVLRVNGSRFGWKRFFLSREVTFDRSEVSVRVLKREGGQIRRIRLERPGSRPMELSDFAWGFRRLVQELGVE